MSVFEEIFDRLIKFSRLNFSSSSTLNFSENGRKKLCPGGLRICDVKFPLVLFCKSELPNADVVPSQLCALCSQFLAMIQRNVIIHAVSKQFLKSVK